MKLLAVPLGGNGAIADYRIKVALGKMGVDYDTIQGNEILGIDERSSESSEGVHSFGEFLPDDWVEALVEWISKNGQKYDVVWTNNYTPVGHLLVDTMRDVFGTKVVADVDDWFEGLPPGNIAAAAWYTTKRRLYKELLEKADRPICSTPKLHDRYGGEICPNFADPDLWDWPVDPDKPKGLVTFLCPHGLGRAGDYLEREPEFKKLLELPNTQMVFVGGFPEWAMEYPVGKVRWCRWVPWEDKSGEPAYKRVVRWLAPDVLLSPLEHNDFNLAKSNLKWLESAMVGACFMGERWGEYERTVKDGETGVLADGREEWAEKLIWLAQDAQARKRIAEQGRDEVVCKWTWPAVESAWRKGVLGDGTG